MPLPEAKMELLADLFERVIAATEAAAEPADKPLFMMSRSTDTGSAAPPALRIDQYATDMLRYRDDAHIAAWKVYGVDGPAWETLTYLRDQSYNAAELAERLENRHHDEAVYAAALQTMLEKGWAEKDNGTFQITKAGRKLRQEAEDRTNDYYFVGLAALNDEEQAKFAKLLHHLREKLNEMAADEAIKTRSDLWPLAGKASGAIFKVTRPVMDPLFEEMELKERGLAFGLIQAAGFDPEPLLSKAIRRRFPYSAASNWDEPLSVLAARGLLAGDGDGGYQFTDDGRSTFTRFIDTFRDFLATVETDLDLDRLAALLGRIVNACLNVPEPPGAWAMQHSHKLMPAEDASALARIDQLLDDLNAFRDDAHIAAFAPYEIKGHGWELFTKLWREEVANAAEMAEKASFRGYSEADYAAALDDLVARGWVEADGDKFILTDAGKEIREAAEVQTDRYFYLPWHALNLAETDEMRTLLTGLEAKLTALAEETAVPA
jgi:DNA-binding MarR family transcriptional regulator